MDKKKIKIFILLLVLIAAAYGIAYIADTVKAKKDGSAAPAEDPLPQTQTDTQESSAFPENEEGQKIVDFAMQYLGSSYAMGGSSPDTGFDCSGFVFYVMGQTGHQMKARTATDQYHYSTPIQKEELIPGDLVFFTGTYGSAEVSHVGIYSGDGKMIHSGDESTGVCISDLNDAYWWEHLYAYGRIR